MWESKVLADKKGSQDDELGANRSQLHLKLLNLDSAESAAAEQGLMLCHWVVHERKASCPVVVVGQQQ